ncbi:MAG: hypothetical protein AB7P42_19325 [Gammaproteobacteria bacterium]
MRKSLLTAALVATSLLSCQVATARSLAVEALGTPLHVFQLDDAGTAPATLVQRPGGRRAEDGEDDAPPPLGAPPEALEDGFQRYFDQHSRVHAASDAAEHAQPALD